MLLAVLFATLTLVAWHAIVAGCQLSALLAFCVVSFLPSAEISLLLHSNIFIYRESCLAILAFTSTIPLPCLLVRKGITSAAMASDWMMTNARTD
jgi:hypothetical protein